MKQFMLNVLATIVGLFATMMIFSTLSFVMLMVLVIAGLNEDAPNVKKNTVLKITLQGEMIERSSDESFSEQLRALAGDDSKTISLQDLITSIDAAADDKKIEGIYLDCRGVAAMPASLEYIREHLLKFKESGKWICAYADHYAQTDYYLASAADSIWINPVGMVDIHGIGGTALYYKNLFDKLGIEMQVFRVGKYKSAVEPYIASTSSDANREQTMTYLNGIWSQIKSDIAASRNVTPDSINSWADNMIAFDDPSTYPARNIVTSLLYRHAAESRLKSLVGIDEDDDLTTISPSNYAKTVKQPSSDHTIALIYADGAIYDSGREGVVSEKLVPVILDIADDDDIEAVVLRVNSPGGSAFASEQIWEALETVKTKGKPLYVSMGDMAASGGYYISAGADKIYAEPTTLTGSIGIYGLIPNLNNLLEDKIGLTPNTFATNPNGVMTTLDALNPVQQASFQKFIDRGYETFVSRCAQGRKLSVDSIKQIAQGRVWTGADAKQIGLVDELGSLTTCIKALAEQSGFDSYSIDVYPDKNLEWWEEILLETENLKAGWIKNELGSAYPAYRAVKDLQRTGNVQARAPFIEIK